MVTTRTRPRLKPTLIVCDLCGVEEFRYYPARKRVRDRMSPYRFCTTEHAKAHWNKRQRAKWQPIAYECAFEGCQNILYTKLAPGRPRLYCPGGKCRAAAARSRKRRRPGSAKDLARIAAIDALQASTLARQHVRALDTRIVFRRGKRHYTNARLDWAEQVIRERGQDMDPALFHLLADYRRERRPLWAAFVRAHREAVAAILAYRKLRGRLARRAATARRRRERRQLQAQAQQNGHLQETVDGANVPPIGVTLPTLPQLQEAAAVDSERARVDPEYREWLRRRHGR